MESATDLEKQSIPERPATPEATKRRAATSPRARVMRVAIGGLVVLAIAATGFWLHGRNRISTDDAQVDGSIVPIAAKISGSVQEVLVVNGDMVKAGQVLVRIDARDYQTRVDQAKAALALAESDARAAQAGVPLARGTTSTGTSGAVAQLANAEAEWNRARTEAEKAASSDIALARSKVASAQATYERAHADLERMRPLAAKAEISQLQFDSFVAAERVAAADLRAEQDRVAAAQQAAQTAQAAAASAQARIEVARAGVAQSRAGEQEVAVSAAKAQSKEAGIEQAHADLAMAELELGYTTILSPTDGEVTRKTVEVGQIVQPGQVFMNIVPLNDVWVTANFKETQLAEVRPGQKAEVKVDMYGRTIEGRVHSIAGATGARMSLLPPENASGNFVKVVQRIPVKIVFDKLPAGVVLRPGMNADVAILTK